MTIPTRSADSRRAAASIWRWLPLLLLTLLSVQVAQAAAALEASVDRTLVTEGDSLTLTIRQPGGHGSGEPDYSPLQRDFQLFGSSQSSRSVISNGHAEAWTEWQLTLMPKRSGQLTIPALDVGSERTAPIRIEVQPAQASASGQPRDSLFIETSVDSDSVYVEQQLLLTVRVFHAVALDDMQLSDPEPEHARVEKVAQNSFRRDIDGVTYQVHELVYAIFAEQPGELVIPELVFSARQPLRSRSFFDFPGQGSAVRRISQPLTVAIKPIPAQFSGTVWLPARNLTLVESWSGNPVRIAVGESMTRSLTLQADGVAAAHLPELPLPTIDGGRLYADQPKLDNGGDARGLHGKRVQSAALIPSRAGALQLPGTKLVWWDVDSDSEKVAEIAPRQLQIRAAAAATSAPPNFASEPAASDAAATDSTATSAPAAMAMTMASSRQLLVWQLGCALLACGWAATLLWCWRRRTATAVAVQREPEQPSRSEAEAFRQLQRACREQQPAQARSALRVWGAALLNREQIGIGELLQRADDTAFKRAVTELEQHLYAATAGSSWHGEPLLASIEVVRKRLRGHSERSAGDTALPPLYPQH